MSDFLRVLVEIAGYVWPFRIVEQWQRGCYYVFGRYWRTVGPGLYPVVPFFFNLRDVDCVPMILSTPLQTVTLRDGKALSFSATMTLQVRNPSAALNRVQFWTETIVELASSLLAERLADVDPVRFDPARGKRDRLLEELRQELDSHAHDWGLQITAVRFTNFAVGVRTYRFLLEKATLTGTAP